MVVLSKRVIYWVQPCNKSLWFKKDKTAPHRTYPESMTVWAVYYYHKRLPTEGHKVFWVQARTSQKMFAINLPRAKTKKKIPDEDGTYEPLTTVKMPYRRADETTPTLYTYALILTKLQSSFSTLKKIIPLPRIQCWSPYLFQYL